MLMGKNVVVGVCGGIAAYKAVDLVSRLKKLNANVDVIMTKNATQFVTPLTFQSISHNPVITDMFEIPKAWDIAHISLAQKADLMVVAPATANIVGKVSSGVADDFLSTAIMASKARVVFVPAMNHNMYENIIVQKNIDFLKQLGYIFIEPEIGLMACGTEGKGRFPDNDTIISCVKEALSEEKKDLTGHKVLITAGPTREAIDPVRYISNHSSGKMGFSIAKAALARGAQVKLVSGPVELKPPSGTQIVNVTSAHDMYKEVMETYKDFDILIMVAAVADYSCKNISSRKIKKSDALVLELIKNPDIAKELGKVKEQRILVGFSAESHELVENAKDKLVRKNMDMIVANDITQEGAGFGCDTNIVKLIKKEGDTIDLPIMDKYEVANRILDEILNIIKGQDI